MANRLATSGDVSGFAASYPTEYAMYLRDPGNNPVMTLNDIILDTVTSVPNNSIVISNIATLFSGARTGFTVWINTQFASAPLKYVNFNNNGVTWTGKASSGSPNRFRVLGGQWLIRHTFNNPTTVTLRIADIEYVDCDFTRDDYKGLEATSWPTFLKGTFGLRIDDENDWSSGNQMFTFDGGIKELRLAGFELYGGFAALRLFPTVINVNQTIDLLVIENFLIAQGLDGEGMYWSESTGQGPYHTFEKVIVRNGIIAHRPLENYQIQHFVSHSHQSLVENVISYNSAMDWRGEVNTIGQSQNFQVIFEEGNTVFRNIIIDGTSANCWFITSGDQGSPVRSRKILIDNCYCGGTKYRNGYIQSGDLITPIDFNNCDFDGSSNEWKEGYTDVTDSTYHIHIQELIEIIARNNRYHNSMDLMGGSLTRLNSPNNSPVSSIVAPDYVNVGLPNNVEQWNQNYGAKLPNAGNPITFKLGKIVYSRTNGRYYKCILQHSSTAGTDPTVDGGVHWQLLSWDTAGVRSDQPGWNSGATQNYLDPPWDFRLKANSYHNLKRRGLFRNLDNNVYSYFVWETATDVLGSNSRRLYRFKDRDISVSDALEEIPSGNYIRRKIYPVDVGGRQGLPDISVWTQVN